MKNVFVYQFESGDQKEKFKELCFSGGLTMHEKFNDLINKELGSPVMAGLDKEAIKFNKQLEAAKNKEKIRLMIKAEREKIKDEKERLKGMYMNQKITFEEYMEKLKVVDKV